MIRSVAVGFAVLLLTSVAVAPALAASGAAGTRLGTPQGFSQTVFTIQVYDNGSATWTFEYSRPLENESERKQFEAFAREFEANESAMYRDFVNRSRRLASAGSEATGRRMNASNFDRNASVVYGFTNKRGVVTLSFQWSNFAVTDGETVRVGDVFEGGLYIGSDQRLVFETGPSLAVTSAAPDSYTLSGPSLESSDTITWVGDRQFTDNHPRVVFEPRSAVESGDSDQSEGTDEATTEPTNRSSGDVLVLVGVFVVIVGLVGAAVWQSGAFSRRESLLNDSAAEAAGAAAEPTNADATGTGIPDEELLSDSDRVVKLLKDNGGRMKQVNIVEETEWSKSKVSMLLSEMEDDGDISKLRVGRENIISLAGHEPDAAGSPFDDE